MIFNFFYELCFDVVGNFFIVDIGNNVICWIDVWMGMILMIVGGLMCGYLGDGGFVIVVIFCGLYSI